MSRHYMNAPHYQKLLADCKSCTRCELHLLREDDPVIYRGPTFSPVMLVGEAPGLREEEQGVPFTGPAGQKLAEWLEWIGADIDDLYITNIAKCRPAAPKGSGKQNNTPKTTSMRTCMNAFLRDEIDHVDPELIIACGKSAAVGLGAMKSSDPITPKLGSEVIVDLGQPRRVFILRHPASMLYARGQPNKYDAIRQEYIDHFQLLRQRFQEAGLPLER